MTIKDDDDEMVVLRIEDFEQEFGPFSFARSLKSYRINEDEMTQEEFAIKIGIPLSSLRDFEKGLKIPSAETAAKIARGMGEPEYFWVKAAMIDAEKEKK